jgi:hypothetical protein
MMKRYIKTPLKYALPLLCIGVLVLSVSISGCTSSENAPTETPTTSSTLAPALQIVESQLKTTYADPSYNLTVGVDYNGSTPGLAFQLNNHGVEVMGSIYSYDTIDSANDSVNTLWATMVHDPGFTPVMTPPHFEMMPIATAALGHTPTTEFDGSFLQVGSSPPMYTDIVQYNTLVVHSDAITGASASATPTPSADYSSYFSTSGFTNPEATLTQPFTKSTNERGDDVYTGVYTSPTSTVTTVIELTKSQADAKQLYQQTVAQKISQGFTLCSYCVAQFRARNPNTPEFWDGKQSSIGAEFSVQYEYDSHVASWEFITQAAPG